MAYTHRLSLGILLILFFTGCSSSRSKDGLYCYDAKHDRDFIVKHFKEDRFWLVADESYMYDPTDTLDTGIHGIVKKPVTFFVYYKNAQPAGFISYYHDSPLFGKIQFVDVDQRFQRQGIAQNMIKAVLTRMKHEGIRSVEIVTRLINKPALTLYEKMGFKKLYDNGKYIYLEYSFD